MGDGGAEGLSAADRGQAAISLMPDADGMHIHIFGGSQLEGSCIGDSQSHERFGARITQLSHPSS